MVPLDEHEEAAKFGSDPNSQYEWPPLSSHTSSRGHPLLGAGLPAPHQDAGDRGEDDEKKYDSRRFDDTIWIGSHETHDADADPVGGDDSDEQSRQYRKRKENRHQCFRCHEQQPTAPAYATRQQQLD